MEPLLEERLHQSHDEEVPGAPTGLSSRPVTGDISSEPLRHFPRLVPRRGTGPCARRPWRQRPSCASPAIRGRLGGSSGSEVDRWR